ncbi:MAG: GGDEF domain-containing protein [Spongiibacteraceae bacterium]
MARSPSRTHSSRKKPALTVVKTPRSPIEQARMRAAQYSQRDLLRALKKLEQENQTLRTQLRMDQLTGVFNRFALDETLECELELFHRSGRISSLIVIDLNHFKHINDTLGHAVGDRLLTNAADYFSSQLRTIDMIARLGGDEFAILLRDTSSSDAQFVAAKLRADAPQFTYTDTANCETTIALDFAIGVAELSPQMDSVDAWFDAADRAMYLHKRAGRLHLYRGKN